MAQVRHLVSQGRHKLGPRLLLVSAKNPSPQFVVQVLGSLRYEIQGPVVSQTLQFVDEIAHVKQYLLQGLQVKVGSSGKYWSGQVGRH